jgi:predicted  nucleic acid-binding Zn-ribbon protein
MVLAAGELKSSHGVSEKLSDGSRIKVGLKAKEQVVVTATETFKNSDQVSFDAKWLRRTFVQTNNRMANDPKLQEVLTLQTTLDKIANDIQTANLRIQTLTTEQGRIRENLKAFDSKSEESGDFRASLKKSEAEIKTLSDTTLPSLNEQRVEAEKSLDAAKMKLTLTWANS